MKKGFTLVELLVVLAILGVVGTISFVSINKVLLKGKQKTLETQYKLIESAAANYINNNLDKELSDEFYLNVNDLYSSGYLNKDKAINPITNEQIEGCVHIYKADNTYRYQYINEC